jgi:hypothetical protein
MSLMRLFRRSPARTPAELKAFLAAQSAFVTQKTVLDYCRVKAGRGERQTFADPDFQAALRHCRWQVFGAAVQDVTAVAEAWLRPQVAGREAALAAALSGLGHAVMADAAPPEEEREALAAAAEALPRHIARLQDAPPVTADRIPLLAEAPLLATLPVHPDQRIGETPAIRGALRFHVVATQQEMERRFDRAALATALVSS